MPRVTIVLPVYNHERYLEEAICSLYAQDYEDYQIVAVNDGSTDGSLEILRRHQSRVLVIDSEHQGPAAARNLGIQATDSEFVAFMDADDRCAPERLHLEVEKLERQKLDLVASALDFIDGHGQVLPGMWTCPAEAAHDYWGALLDRNWIGTPSVMMRRNALNAAGLFNETFTHGEDYDLWLRAGRTHSIGYIDSALVHCRRHAANTSMSIGSHQHFERMALRNVDRQEALEAFNRLHMQPQRRAEAWIWFLLRRGDASFSEEASRAMAEHPYSRLLRFALGVFQYDCGEYEEALATFDSLKESDASALHNLGLVHAQRGDVCAAESHLEAALKLQPGYHDAQYNLAALRSGQAVRLTRRPLRQHVVPMMGVGQL
jgi:glycosyltransferase involved in cell wall biosynthesis